MAQNAEAQAFLRRLGELPTIPGVDLGPAIIPSLQDEESLRRLFATDRNNSRLKDPYVGLVDVFGQNTDRIKTIHARAIQDDEDLRKHHVMPLNNDSRRKDGESSMASSLEDFKTRFAVFTEGALSQLTNWNNVVVAGGSVLACLAPLPKHITDPHSKRALRKYYHSEAYPASDVDLFLYGLTPQQAEEKCVEIYNAVQDSVPWDICAVRTKNAVSIHCQYPCRPVQIVLRIYQSPAEILAGFDVDSACVAFDGNRVLAAPRAIMALMTQCNQVSMNRRSPSYEVRLVKYAARGFEIHVPDLRREDLDPTIFERALTRVSGLARLLVLEKLASKKARDGYLDQRRQMRGGPDTSRRYARRHRRLNGDFKSATAFAGLEMSDYDVMFHIPYGHGITAKRIRNLVYRTDIGLNTNFNPKNKGRRFHRHPVFFGNMKEALEDCCEHCPLPITDEEKEVFRKEQEQFITGRVSFIQVDPGRQSITGSFRPIDSGEWSEQAYITPLAKLFSYIASHNRQACNDFLEHNADAIKSRDHLGRTPLQFALLCSAEDICLDLIAQGGRMTSRMIDGRCSLHLAAQMGLLKVVKALLEKSKKNKMENQSKKEAKAEGEENSGARKMGQDDEVRDSSEDDWSSAGEQNEDSGEARKVVSQGPPAKGEKGAPDDSEDGPDILKIDAPDWDHCLTALGYAIINGSLPIVQVLVAAGADCKTPASVNNAHGLPSVRYPLILTALTADESVGAQIAEHLITVGGASCSAADSERDILTVFHRLVLLNKSQIVERILKIDPTARVASRFLHVNHQSALHPIVSAFASGQRAMIVVLLAYGGSRAFIDLETYDRAVAANSNTWGAKPGEENWQSCTLQPLEAALTSHNDLYRLVLALEPESIRYSVPQLVYKNRTIPYYRRSMLDVLRSGLREMKRRSRDQPKQSSGLYDRPSPWRSILDLSDAEISELKGWDAHAISWERRHKDLSEPWLKEAIKTNFLRNGNATEDEKRAQAKELIPYFQRAVEEFEKTGARTWDELYKDTPSEWNKMNGRRDFDPDDPNPPTSTPSVRLPRHPFSFGKAGAQLARQHGFGLTAETTDETKKPFKRYVLFMPRYREDYPGEHLTPLYDELYDACWNGDNDKIRALCLPPGDDPTAIPSGTRDLLQITVRVTYTEHTTYHSKGYTPLHVALRSRKWDTARLILEIAEEQYTDQEDEEELEPFGSSLVQRPGIQNQTENQPVDKTDDAAGVHAVSVNVKPNELLSYQTKCAIGSESASAYIPDAGPLTLFIRENDLEAFTQIADMVATLKEPTSIEFHLYDILRIDSAAMLDAYIRRTGAGLLLPEPSVKDATTQLRHRDYNSRGRYLGLNVHGKKRREHGLYEWSRAFYQLETQAPVGLNVQGMRRWDREPDPWFLPFSGPRGEVGLAWQAASNQAIEVLDYLNSPNAIQAFKYYAENNTTDLATRIAKALQNTDDFPKMAGFFVNRLAETPVLATFWNTAKPDRILPTLKKLMELQPKLTADGIRLQIKPNRMSALFLLCTTKAPVEAFDWMLANGADPLLRDERGWNILHVLFSRHDLHWPLIEHAVTKLPITTIETLMAHQSRIRRNTPFSIAVKMSNLKLVDLLLRTVKSAVLPALLLRDSTGATPLHLAVLSGYSKIVSLVVAAGPSEILSVENGVGSTPAEVSRLQLLSTTLRGLANPLVHPSGLYIQAPDSLNLTPAPGMRDCDVEEVKSLRRVIDGIKASGTLAQKPELLEVLSNFADDSEQESATWEARKPKDTAQLPDYDVEDVKATFDILSEAFTEVGKRQAVHLHDIQLAVHTAIEAPAETGHMAMFRRHHLGEEDPDLKQDSNWSAIIGYPLTDHEIVAEKTTHRGVTVF